MLSGIAPRKAGAKLLIFHKTNKFLYVFYQIKRNFLRFRTLLIVKNIDFERTSAIISQRKRTLTRQPHRCSDGERGYRKHAGGIG